MGHELLACIGCFWFIVSCVITTYTGMELYGKLEFNDDLKFIETNVTHHNIYKETTEYPFYVRGKFYVDFPTFDSSFEICHDKGYDKSINECKKYLKRYYPIGKPTIIYYNPDNISDSRLEEVNNDWLIVEITLLCILMCCSCCCFIGGFAGMCKKSPLLKVFKFYFQKKFFVLSDVSQSPNSLFFKKCKLENFE